MTPKTSFVRIMPGLVAMVLAAVAPAAAQLDGTFTLRGSESGERVNLNLQYGGSQGSNWGRMIDRSALVDVTRSGDRLTFNIRRPAGTMAFEGKGTIERAAGFYTFTPDSAYRTEIERLGFKNVDDKALFVLAMDDLSIAGVKQLQGLVADTLDTAQLVRLINHGAGVRYVQAMTDAGFARLESSQYRRARDHGVDAEFVRDMAGFGVKGPLEELVRLRDHGVSGDFVRRMSALGYQDLALSEYVRMRDHGVTPDFVEAVRDAGIKPTAAEAVRLKDHGVTADYVRRVKEQFKTTLTVEQIIRLRSRGELPK